MPDAPPKPADAPFVAPPSEPTQPEKSPVSPDSPQTSPLSESESNHATPVDSDDSFNRIDLERFDKWSVGKLMERDVSYTNILSKYEMYVGGVLSNNLTRQDHFYELSMLILFFSPIQFFICVAYCLQHQMEVTAIAALLASAAEILGVIIIIPKIIAEYLFNTGETTSIKDIVSAIQNYDVEIRQEIRRTAENK